MRSTAVKSDVVVRQAVLAVAFLPCVSLADNLPSGFVDEAKAQLVRSFKDPDSAKYRDLYIGEDRDGSPILCGEVNAKNGRAAMVGFRAFFAKPGESKVAPYSRDLLADGTLAHDYQVAEAGRCKTRKPL